MKKNSYGFVILVFQIIILLFWIYFKFLIDNDSHVGGIASFFIYHLLSIINLVFIIIYIIKHKKLNKVFIWRIIIFISVVIILRLFILWFIFFIDNSFPILEY